MPRRTNKFYRKNEASLMKSLGLKPTPNSGSGWLVKEDGTNDFLIAQLKSTDANSIGVSLTDIRALEYNATVEHKVPIFMLQFLKTNDVFVLMRPSDIEDVAMYLQTGKREVPDDLIEVTTYGDAAEGCRKFIRPTIQSGSRDDFWQEKEEERKRWQKK